MLTAICAVLASAAAASTYPTSGASTFDRNAQGWTSLGTSCTVTTGGGLTSLCSQTNTYDGTVGNPKGSISSTMRVVANGGGLFRGQGTWRSPTFTASASAVSGVLELDRRFDIASPLVTLDPSANLRAALVDERSGARAQLLDEDISAVTGQFAKRRATFGAGTLVKGRRYHIELTTTTTTKSARIGLLGDLIARYDNVQLTVNDAPGASGTQGVTFPGSPISSNRFGYLARRLSINAQAGRGPGGTLVPIRECTILGTPGNDRITGSTGNDVICGLGGNDRIDGGRGRDIIDGGNGNDRLSGSRGSDLVVGLRGRDRLSGSSGNDRLGGGGGKDRLSGGSGRDRLAGGSGNDRLGGGSGSDRLSGGRGRDRIGGGPGNDRISAKDRTRDRVDGGRGRDTATVDRPRSRASRRGVRAPRVDRVRRVERVRG
jgi:Ca2+-binding RTX toxin-like protein